MENKSDVFRAFLVKNAQYAGKYEIPIMKPTNSIPKKVIPFSKAISSKAYDSWVMFYENDDKFMRVWNNPKRYLQVLKQFQGVISPDFSVYRNMPLCMQIESTYKGKALGHFFQENGIDVIPNVRFNDERTFEFCFDGVPKNSIVSIGTHGCIKKNIDKAYFKIGLSEMLKVLSPKAIVVYGSAPDSIFEVCHTNHVELIQFDSDTAKYFASKKEVM